MLKCNKNLGEEFLKMCEKNFKNSFFICKQKYLLLRRVTTVASTYYFSRIIVASVFNSITF